MVNLHFRTKEQLKEAYLHFLKDGGLIIPVDNAKLSDIFEVELTLLEDKDPILFYGRVVWLIPPGAHIPQYDGVGVEFIGDNAKLIRKKIEMLLGTDAK